MSKKMPRINISLSKGEIKFLKSLAKKEHRPVSRQIVHMMYEYVKNKGC